MTLFLLCSKIFFVGIINITIGTIRTVMSVRGKKFLAMILSFIEVLIWFLIIKEALKTSEKSILIALCYAGGYAVGTFIGTALSVKINGSKVLVRAVLNEFISNSLNDEKLEIIKCDNKKIMIFKVIDIKEINDFKNKIKEIDNDAFFMINKIKE